MVKYEYVTFTIWTSTKASQRQTHSQPDRKVHHESQRTPQRQFSLLSGLAVLGGAASAGGSGMAVSWSFREKLDPSQTRFVYQE
jgi:hypothetical protein